MHLRFSTHRSGDTVRRYAQLVESYRRDDGMPAHRVIASLGQLSDTEVENLKTALAASRAGRSVVLPAATAQKVQPTRVVASLDYVDVAVALDAWERLRLPALLDELIAPGSDDVSASRVVAALTLQRCLAPGSKLCAARWFPRTALPELLDVDPRAFNNSRIHRVLDQLEGVDDALQTALPEHYALGGSQPRALFLDVTDTWFEGRGPDMAERGRTKEGFSNRRRVGIVLLCNEDGLPMRWRVLSGDEREASAMKAMFKEVASLPWVGDAPIVCDRAMGQASMVANLAACGARFVTASYRTEILSWTKSLPTAPFAAHELPAGVLDLEEDEPAPLEVLRGVGQVAHAAGLERVADDLYVLDVGVVSRTLSTRATRQSPTTEDAPASEAPLTPTTSPGADWLRRALGYKARIAQGEFRSQADLARALNMSRARVTQVMRVLKLAPVLQRNVLDDVYGPVSVAALRDIDALTTEQQRRLLEDIGRTNAAAGRRTTAYAPTARALKRRNHTPIVPAGEEVAAQAAEPSDALQARVRLITCFNPVLFVDQRRHAARQRARFEARLGDLNRRIANANTPRPVADAYAAANTLLASAGLRSVYDLQVDSLAASENAPERAVGVNAILRADAWARRRQFDGFVLLLAHHELPQSATELVRLYRDKDAVEKDFQTIKSVVRLRPVYHRTDAKLRAHVTLCMLALLVERTLEARLRAADAKTTTAPMLFELLETARISVLGNTKGSPTFAPTQLNAEQAELLAKLELSKLGDAAELAARLRPRPEYA